MDRGAIGRNVEFNQRALERAAQRNGGQNIPDVAPQSVTGEDDISSQAVNRGEPWVGPNGGE